MTMAIIQCLSVIILHLFGIVLTADSYISVKETNKDVYIDIFNELREELKEHKTMYIKQIEELRKQVTSNEQRIKQLEGVNEKIKSLNGKCMNEMIMQKTHMDIISEIIQHLEGKWEKMKVDNGICMKEMMMLKTKVNNIREKDEDMTDTIKVNTHTRKETEEENKAAKIVKRSFSEFQDRKPAFSAAISGPHITELGKYQTVVFDHVFTNIGNGYSPLTGVFTTPTNGTYYFTATVMSDYGDYVETEISLNGNSMVYMMSGDSKYEQGHNSIVLDMKAGDKVWVRLQTHQGTTVHGDHWSTFSGFQIDN